MATIKRTALEEMRRVLKRGKSVLLLGPRQTGKTTLVEMFPADLTISFLSNRLRLQYESNPDLIIKEATFLKKGKSNALPLIVIDEVQKVPTIMDPIQLLIDKKKAQFIITGSSARKLKRQSELNLLPGRVISLRMDGLSVSEFEFKSLDNLLYFGALPEVVLNDSPEFQDDILRTYIETYVEEEIRKEANLRKLPEFFRFLESAALDSGKVVSYSKIASEVGLTHVTVKSYYQILVDTLLAERIEPITESATRKKLLKSPRFVFFDLGVRRWAAREGYPIAPERKGLLFEQFVGLEIIKLLRISKSMAQLCYWQDPQSAEVDWVIRKNNSMIPIEVKLKSMPDPGDIRHLKTFIAEYDCPHGGFVICDCRNPFELAKGISAWPWKKIPELPWLV